MEGTESLSQLFRSYGSITLGILLSIVLGVIAYRLLSRGFALAATRRILSDGLRGIILGVLRWTIIVIVVLTALQLVGVPVTNVWAGLSTILITVAVGFVAVWSILSNVLSTVLLILVEPFRIGDDIEIMEPVGGKGLRGRVVALNFLYTSLEETLEDGDTAVVQVPNNVFFQKTIRRRVGGPTRALESSLEG